MDRLHSFLRPFSAFIALALTVVGLVSDDRLWLLALAGVLLCALYLIWSTVPRPTADQQERFSRNVQYMAGFVLAGFALLALNLLREQVVQAQATLNTRAVSETREIEPGVYERETTVQRGDAIITQTRRLEGEGVDTTTRSAQNQREVQAGFRVQRGQIFDAGGQVVAGREVFPDSNFVRRTYPLPGESYIVGFYNPTIYGIFGLEQKFDDYLSGRVGVNPILEQENRILHRPVVGQDVYITIDPAIQAAAQEGLGQRAGGIVVLDAQTGAILADASYPHYDPNGLAFNPNADDWNAENGRIIQYWQGLTSDPSTPLVLRATQGRYPPGSTYKTVTLAAAIDMGIVRPDSPFTDTGRLVVEPGAPPDVDCNGCRPARNPPIFSLQEGYQWSLNIVFAQLGLRVGADKLVEYSRRFGYDNAFEDVGIPIAPSRVAVEADFLKSKKALAGTSYGQGQMQATALQMALVAAGVAHGGAVPAPYIVQKVVNPANGTTVLAASPRDLGRAVSPSSATTLQQMMITSVEKGYAVTARIPGATVGGKTGTAETGRGTNHAWFIAFAGPDPTHLRYAIAVVLEEGGEGSRVAAPLAKQVLQVALQK